MVGISTPRSTIMTRTFCQRNFSKPRCVAGPCLSSTASTLPIVPPSWPDTSDRRIVRPMRSTTPGSLTPRFTFSKVDIVLSLLSTEVDASRRNMLKCPMRSTSALVRERWVGSKRARASGVPKRLRLANANLLATIRLQRQVAPAHDMVPFLSQASPQLLLEIDHRHDAWSRISRPLSIHTHALYNLLPALTTLSKRVSTEQSSTYETPFDCFARSGQSSTCSRTNTIMSPYCQPRYAQP